MLVNAKGLGRSERKRPGTRSVASLVGAMIVLGTLFLATLTSFSPAIGMAPTVLSEEVGKGFVAEEPGGSSAERVTRVQDTADQAWSILAPGNGGLIGPTSQHRGDQIAMYDNLDDPVADNSLTDKDLSRYYKDSRLGVLPDDVERVERPREGVEIFWDHFGVPHVFGETSADVAFGAGWVTAEARLFVAEVMRAGGRAGTAELSGNGVLGVFDVAGDQIAYTEEELQAQLDALCVHAGEECPEILERFDAYAAGINQWVSGNMPFVRSVLGDTWREWRPTDIVATIILLSVSVGNGGGNEVKNAEAFALLQERDGREEALALWDTLRFADDPSARSHTTDSFPYPLFSDGTGKSSPSSDTDWDAVALPDAELLASVSSSPLLSASPEKASPVEGTAFSPLYGIQDTPSDVRSALAAKRALPAMHSNYLVLDGTRTASGHPLLVGSPQLGYVTPNYLFEIELQGGGYQSTGMTMPGVAFLVLIGHTDTYAWSVTSGMSDLVDMRVELLCEPDGSAAHEESVHYEYRDECVPMTRVGEQNGLAKVAPRTVHGPVASRGTVDGRPVAVAQQRSSRGHEVMSALSYFRLNSGEVTDGEAFVETLDDVAFSLNWVYASAEDIAYFHSGRYPVRASGVHPDLPVWGTGEWEWQGIMSSAQHPSAVNPSKGYFSSWNNKVAPGWRSADNYWYSGPYHRVELLDRRLGDRTDFTLAAAVSIVQDAGTADLRAALIVPELTALAERFPPSSFPGAEQMLAVLVDWEKTGANRRDRDRNQFADHAGEVLIEGLVTPLVDLVLSQLLGDLQHVFSPISPIDSPPGFMGSSFGGGGLAHVLRDLQQALQEGDGFVCGNGDLAICAEKIWGALEGVYWSVREKQSPWVRDDISRWTTFVGDDRIRFLPGMPAQSMRWVNRGSYQQAVSYG